MQHKNRIRLVTILWLNLMLAMGQNQVTVDPLSKGRLLYEQKYYIAANEFFARYLLNQSHTEGYFYDEAKGYSALCAAQLGTANAEELLSEYIASRPGGFVGNLSQYELGTIYYTQSKHRQAQKAFNEVAPDMLPDDIQPTYYFEQGYTQMMLKDTASAIKSFNQSLQHNSEVYEAAIFYRSHIQYNNKQYPQAAEGFKMVETHPDFKAEACFYLANIMWVSGETEAALDYANKGYAGANAARKPEFARIIGEASLKNRNYTDAKKYLGEYAKSDKKALRDNIYQLGLACYALSDYEEAIKNFGRVATADDALSQNASNYMGAAYLKLGDKKNALMAFDAAGRSAFDKTIQEEALFNYAKLTVELAYSPFAETITALQRFLDKYPESKYRDEVYDMLSYALENTSNYAKALETLAKIGNKTPEIAKAKQRVAYYRGIELYNDKKYTDAANTFTLSITEAVPGNDLKARAYYWRGESYYQQTQYEKAIADYNRFLAIPGMVQTREYAMTHYNMAYAWFKQKNYAGALSWFRRYVEQPHNKSEEKFVVDGQNRIGDCYFIQRDYTQAVRYYNMAAITGTAGADYALYQKAICQGLLKQYKEKIGSLDQLIRSFQRSSFIDEAWYEKGRAYVMIENHAKAIESFKVLIDKYKNTPTYRKAMSDLALVYYNTGETGLAQESFKAILNQFPGTEEAHSAYNALRSISVDQNKVDEFIAFSGSLKNPVQIENNMQDSLLFAAAERLLINGKLKEAQQNLKNYIDKFPQGRYRIAANYNMADCILQQGDVESAIPYLKYVVDAGNSDYTNEALWRLAIIEDEAGNKTDAMALYKRVIAAGGKQEQVLGANASLARLSYNAQQWDSAIAYGNAVAGDNGASDELAREATLYIGRSYQEKGNATQALDWLSKLAANTNTREGSEAKFRLAEIYFNQKNIAKSEAEITDFIKKKTSYPYWLAKSFVLLSDIMVLKKDLFQARQYLTSVRDNYSGDETISLLVKQKLEALTLLEEQKTKKQ